MANVLAVSFEEGSKAYEALTVLKELESQGQVHTVGAAVVVRDEDGQVVVKDAVGDSGREGMATGGIIGLLVGILGGPFGVLLGGATGLLWGSLFDVSRAEETESVLSAISQSVRVGQPVLLAEVDEQSGEVVDSAMSRLDGTVERHSLDDVEAEIAAAEEAQRAAAKEARKQLREQRQAQLKGSIGTKVDALKSKLHRGERVEAPSS